MKTRNKVLKLSVGLLALCLGGTAVILFVARLFIGGALKEPTTVGIQVEAPKQVLVNEPFVVTLQLTNLTTDSQTLHSLDLEESFLEHMSLIGSAPHYHEVQSLPLTGFASYTYALELPADIINRPTVIELTFVGQAVGEFSGVIDVCLDDGTFCKAVLLEKAVTER